MEKYLGVYLMIIGILTTLIGSGVLKIEAIDKKVPSDRKRFISVAGLILLLAGLLYSLL